MKKILIFIIILSLLVSIVLLGFGCKKETTETTATETTATETTSAETTSAETTVAKEPEGNLSVMTSWTGGIEFDGLSAVGDAFRKEYPNINLEILGGGDSYATDIQVNLASSDPVDAFVFWPMAGRLRPFVEANLIIPLDDIYAETDYDKRAPSVADIARVDAGGSPYDMPINNHVIVVWYNKHVFADANIDEKNLPKTWDDFLALCQKLKDAGKIPLAVALTTPPFGLSYYSDYSIARTTDDQYRIDLMDLKASFNDDRWKKAMDIMTSIKPYIHPDSLTIDYGTAALMFANGEVAMTMHGTWLNGTLQAEMNKKPFVDYDYFEFPIIDPSVEKIGIGAANGFAIAKNSKNIENAKLWLKFWTREETQLLFANITKANAALLLSDTSKIEDSLSKKAADELLSQPVHYDWGGIDGAVYVDTMNQMVDLLYGKVTIDKQIENLENIIKTYKESQGK